MFCKHMCILKLTMENYGKMRYHADDSSPYVSGKIIDEVVKLLEEALRLILNGLVTISSQEIQANVMCC